MYHLKQKEDLKKYFIANCQNYFLIIELSIDLNYALLLERKSMGLSSIKTIIEVGLSSKIPIIIKGEKYIGKTEFCKSLFSEYKLVLDGEYSSSGFTYLNSVFKN